MKKCFKVERIRRIFVKGSALLLAGTMLVCPIIAGAATISDVKKQIEETQNLIDNINNKIGDLEDQQSLVEEMIDDLNAEIVNTMTSIGLKEDEIAEKEAEIIVKQGEVDAAEAAFYEAKATEEKQYDDMMARMKAMYETGNSSYLDLILQGQGLGDILNRMDFVEKIYSYDKNKFEEFKATREAVNELWDDLVLQREGLEQDKAGLEVERQNLQDQKAGLDVMLAQRKKESSNYDNEIAKAKQEAAVAKTKLKQEQAELKKLESAAAMANKKFAKTDYTKTIDGASGSDLGKQIAKYGCQFIGNPYVYGGTSLTKGADCSGFTYRIYADFGYSIPRTSYEQRSTGTAVEYKNAQPGDLICYNGHVGMYIGGGMIVHASSAKTGIKVSNATYREILAVRRII